MTSFSAVLCPGKKVPYDTWTFLVFPASVAAAWGPGRFEVRGTINGAPFSGRASWGEGALRIPLASDLREALGLVNGDRVAVTLERAPAPPPLAMPPALAALLAADASLRAAFDALPPSARRAWASHIESARRAETVTRRLEAARDGIPARRYP